MPLLATLLLIQYLLARLISNTKLRYIAIFISSIWMFPLILDTVLPFEIPAKMNYAVAIYAILSVFYMVFVPIIVIEKYYSVRSVKGTMKSAKAKGVNLLYVLSYISIFCLFIDLYYLRGLSLFSGIGGNRDIYINTSPSLFGYVSIMFLGNSILLLTFVKMVDGKYKKLKYGFPFILAGSLMLLSGNRQFVFFGLLYYLILFFLFSKLNKGFVKQFIAILLVGVVFFSAMVSFQFNRQKQLEGNQLEFLYSISEMSCQDSMLCDSSLAIPFAYLYQYFGNEYQGLSVSVDINIKNSPIFSLTQPILYRRIYNIFGLEEPLTIHNRIFSAIESKTGMFPHFWSTMFSQIYLEYGIFGVLLFPNILMFIHFSLLKSYLLKNTIIPLSKLSTFYASIAFGIMFIPTVEVFIFFLYIFGFWPVLWKRIQYKS